MGFNVADIHNQRTGPYTSWPKDAISKGLTLDHLGAQVSFSGSLIENLNHLKAAGNGNFNNWLSPWNQARQWKTSKNNYRLDLVGFGYHHPLMGLIPYFDIRKQIQAHKNIFAQNFTGSYSKGIFPPENAFTERMIPALTDEGFQWVLVDNIHFDRTCKNYPFSTGGNIYEPNRADIQNPDPNDWVALNNLWAPTKNSARWGRQPHYAQYIDPATGKTSRIIVVPCDRYMGNEDGRGGFGALNYDNVMSQLAAYNTDPHHPILIVLHHDGDNYGGGSQGYYDNNFQNFVNWLKANPNRFVCTTVQDYLDMFPPDTSDIIHVEDGSWSGADNGDPEFKKWNGDPYNNYSPDRNSWGVITAAQNYVHTAQQINPNAAPTQNAWKFLMNAEASDYWYWDGSSGGLWDAHPTRGSNLAINEAKQITATGNDQTPPTIYIPQREPYNPGGKEWNKTMSSDFKVWTYIYDISGLKSAVLKYRLDRDGVNNLQSNDNETYAGGSEVGSWQSVTMTAQYIAPQTNPQPIYKAFEYSAMVSGLHDTLVDYYIEATDSLGNTSRSAIQHVYIGGSASGSSGNATNITWSPINPTRKDTITITVNNATKAGKLHWGVNFQNNNWVKPDSMFYPTGTNVYSKNAVESPMDGPASNILKIKLGPFSDTTKQALERMAFVIHYNDNTWDNNGGSDYKIYLSGIYNGGGGGSGNTGGTYGISWSPANPTDTDIITLKVTKAPIGGKLHWGINGWQQAQSIYWPSGSALFQGNGPALQSPMSGPDTAQQLTLQIGPFNNAAQTVSKIDFVINYNDGTWDNNNGADYHIPITKAQTGGGGSNTGIADISPNVLQVYPNPTDNIIYIPCEWDGTITVLNIQGRMVLQKNVPAGMNRISLEGLPAGCYILRLHNQNDSIQQRVMLQPH